MLEITYNDREKLRSFMENGKAYSDAQYDFTFENRYIIYHFFIKDKARYVALDMRTGSGSSVTERKKDCLLKPIQHKSIIPLILYSIKYTGDKRYNNTMETNPLEIIESIFKEILPRYGYNFRPQQLELCKKMYKGLIGKQVAICEAEVGTGKTLAYLIASFVAKKCGSKNYGTNNPITVTTSSIELQKAIVEREIPRLSRIFYEYGLINRPIVSVLRKGREHYFCISRYKDYLDKISQSPRKYKKLINYFKNTQFHEKAFDLDTIKIPADVKARICVKSSCRNCANHDECKYTAFVNHANSFNGIDYQVTNHNLYLANLRLKSEENGQILQPGCYIIIDEAHKFKDAAQDAFGEQISENSVYKYINSVKTSCACKSDKTYYSKALEEASELNRKLFMSLRKALKSNDNDENRSGSIVLSDKEITFISQIMHWIKEIELKRKKSHGIYDVDGNRLVKSLKIFTRQNNINIWLSCDDNKIITLCCSPKNIACVLKDNVWSKNVSHVLTSGTMSDGTDFSFFKKENGIDRLGHHAVQESITLSPFRYDLNARLFIPSGMPIPDNDSEEYIDAIAEVIIDLIHATNGHTAILFTSYKVLQSVYEKTIDKLVEYNVFSMTRSNKTAISDFKRSKNGILFASGSMWEGVDCIGDCLSSVIIVKLPFPMRSAIMEQKKIDAADITTFIKECAVPEMLIKLRQGAGRLIRSETDTGLITILDSRALGNAYSEKVKIALKKYPVVDSVEEIKSFFKTVKSPEYFE